MKKNLELIEKENSDTKAPSQEVLGAFGLTGKPKLLKGGQGESFLTDNVVLKRIKDIPEASWIADVYYNLQSDKFRVPEPVRSKDNRWVYNNWTAFKFVSGEHRKNNYREAIQVSKNFHQALTGMPKPAFFDQRKNVFAIADRIAWGELPRPDFKITNEPLTKIFSLLKKNELPFQVIHGDMGPGNILFETKLPPAVIDFSPYYRPADFAIAVMVIDALVYEGADSSIFQHCQRLKDFDQLLLRALARRICEYIGHQSLPERINDYIPEIKKHLQILDIIIKY